VSSRSAGESEAEATMSSKRSRGSASSSASKRQQVVELVDDYDAGPSRRADAEDKAREAADYMRKIQQIKALQNDVIFTGKVSAEEMNSLVGTVMRYVLFRTGQHKSQPIPRNDIAALVTKKYPGPARQGLTKLVIAKAQGQFADIMGLEMKELVRKTESGEASATRSYILRSLLPKRYQEAVAGPKRGKERERERQEKSLLLVILMMISLSGDQMTEAKLWEHLGLLGIEKDTKHATFGDTGSAMLYRFVRQRYLQKVAKKSDNGRVWLYQPGENALDEIDQMSLSDAISKTLQKGHNMSEMIEID